MTDKLSLTADDGHTIHLKAWLPESAPTLAVQILHGMGEHIGRYTEFAAALNSAGIAVYAHNHRGHGEHAELRGHFADKNGWQRAIEDAQTVNEHIASEHPNLPVVLFGHSMGSFLAQHCAVEFGSGLSGMVLSGSTLPSKLRLIPGLLMARFILLFSGRRAYKALLDEQGINSLNKRFQPARTHADWLSRDEARVDQYVSDPLCGVPFTIGFWLDLLGGMLQLSSASMVSRIRSDLPILIVGGSDDPVGGDNGMGKLMTRYAETGHQRLSIKIYPGGRHEMLNETNRDTVIDDIIAWLKPRAKTA